MAPGSMHAQSTSELDVDVDVDVSIDVGAGSGETSAHALTKNSAVIEHRIFSISVLLRSKSLLTEWRPVSSTANTEGRIRGSSATDENCFGSRRPGTHLGRVLVGHIRI